MTVDTFYERAENYSQFENTIVICDQVDKSIATVVADFIIKFPKLEEWQIFDYAKMLCPHVDNEDLLWLVKATDNNIERVSNELEKVALFTGNDQKAIFSAIRFDAQTDLYKADSLKLTDALAKGDAKVLFDFLKHSSVVDIDPVALANGTLTKLKDIILVSQNLDLTAEDCGISTKYFNYIRRNYYNLNINVVKHKIKFLANFDLALKTSKLDMSKHDMLNYLINNLMYKIT
jgi:DNA polymerase III delta subunit